MSYITCFSDISTWFWCIQNSGNHYSTIWCGNTIVLILSYYCACPKSRACRSEVVFGPNISHLFSANCFVMHYAVSFNNWVASYFSSRGYLYPTIRFAFLIVEGRIVHFIWNLVNSCLIVIYTISPYFYMICNKKDRYWANYPVSFHV